MLRALQRHGNAEGLDHRQDDRQIAGPLRDFAPPEFAFFLQLFKRWHHYCQQLQDDRRSDVGHDAQSENGQPPETSPAEHIQVAEQSALILPEELFQFVRVDPRGRDVPTQAIHRQQSQREQEPLAQIRNAKDIRYGFEELHAC